MTRVIIVRHGQSTYNIEKRIQGRTDASSLTEKGQNDANQAGKALSSISFQAIYSSPLQRAKSTAEIIRSQLAAQAPVIQIDEQLVEIDLPVWVGMTTSEVQEKLTEDYRTWKERPHEFPMVLQEDSGTREHFPVLALYTQAKQFWQEILPQHQGETILIVGHNGINRALISTAL
jgi:probable phosphoglycerate mutase